MPDFKPTVMPKDTSNEVQNTRLGDPGLSIPKDAENIKEFKEVSNVDAKSLNAKLQSKDEVLEKERSAIEKEVYSKVHDKTDAEEIISRLETEGLPK